MCLDKASSHYLCAAFKLLFNLFFSQNPWHLVPNSSYNPGLRNKSRNFAINFNV